MFKRVLATAPAQLTQAARVAAISTARPQFVRSVAPATQQITSRRSYHEKVLDHYNNPRNVGSMKKGDVDVGTGLVGAPACGDVMKLQIKVGKNADGEDLIEDVKFKTFGCGSAIASSSYLTELVRGMTLEQAGKIRNTEIARELCLPPVKRKFLNDTSIRSTRTDANVLSQFTALCLRKTLSRAPSATTTPRTPRLAQQTLAVLELPCPRLKLKRFQDRELRHLPRLRMPFNARSVGISERTSEIVMFAL